MKSRASADCQETRPIYECIQVRPFGEKQTLVEARDMDEEGDVDDESDVDDDDLDEDEIREAREAGLVVDHVSEDSREGSPMDIS